MWNPFKQPIPSRAEFEQAQEEARREALSNDVASRHVSEAMDLSGWRPDHKANKKLAALLHLGEKEARRLNKEYDSLRVGLQKAEEELEDWEIEMGLRPESQAAILEEIKHTGSAFRGRIEVVRTEQPQRKRRRGDWMYSKEKYEKLRQDLIRIEAQIAGLANDRSPFKVFAPYHTQKADILKKKERLDMYANTKRQELSKKVTNLKEKILAFETTELGMHQAASGEDQGGYGSIGWI